MCQCTPFHPNLPFSRCVHLSVFCLCVNVPVLQTGSSVYHLSAVVFEFRSFQHLEMSHSPQEGSGERTCTRYSSVGSSELSIINHVHLLGQKPWAARLLGIHQDCEEPRSLQVRVCCHILSGQALPASEFWEKKKKTVSFQIFLDFGIADKSC